jgi:hypothetical protein
MNPLNRNVRKAFLEENGTNYSIKRISLFQKQKEQ